MTDLTDRARAGTLPENPRDLTEPLNGKAVEADERRRRRGGSVALMGFRLTDTGNAERFVARFRDRVRFCPPRKRWLLWDGRRWRWDDLGEVQQLAKVTVRGIYDEAKAEPDGKRSQEIARHACASETASRRAALVQLAQSEEGIPVLPTDLDADPWAFNVANGTIDLRTGQLRRHRREDLITKLSPVEYDPAATSELWDQYLRDATGGDEDLAAYLQRSVGYALQGTVTEKAFWFLHGPPDGMKSTFVDAIDGALGDYHTAAAFETWVVQSSTGGNRGDLVRLMGARLVSSVEVRKGARFDEAILKAVTGGDLLTCAAKYEAEISFLPGFALWLAANDAPVIRDDDEGAWSRVRRIPFVHPLPKDRQDPTMRAKLREPAQRAAILAWAVKGCLAWQQQGIGTCAAVESSTAEYRSEMDRVAGFFAEWCAFEERARVQRSVLRQAYEEWCRENGVRTPLVGKEFGARLRERGVVDGKSDGKRMWTGVRLLESWEADGDSGCSTGTGVPETSSRELTGQLPGIGGPEVAPRAFGGPASSPAQVPTAADPEPELTQEVF